MWPPTRFKDHTAIVFKDTRLTFSQFDACVNRLSNGLLSLGLATGHKVAVLLNNGLESAISLLAVPRAGLTYISLNARHSSGEHAAILNDSEADAIIVGEEFIEIIKPALTLVSSLKHFIVVGRTPGDWLVYNALIADQSALKPAVDVDDANDIERIQYTSGTTGKPKGVELLHDCWVFTA